MNIRTLTNKLKKKYTFVGGEQHGYIKVGKNGLLNFVWAMHMQMATALKRTWGGCKVVPLGSRKSKLGSANITVLSLAFLPYVHQTPVIEQIVLKGKVVSLMIG